MPFEYARRLTSEERTSRTNRHLGVTLAFVAGAINAGGFLAVGQYTSHMTGIVSSMADNAVLGSYAAVAAGLGAVLSFAFGAAATSLIVNYARRHGWYSLYAAPLLLEAVLLLFFGALGAQLQHIEGLLVPLTVTLLCFIMGLQNAVITKVSRSEIRTTHLTGIVTDIGIELGRLVFVNGPPENGRPVLANRQKLRLLVSLALAFFIGGVIGAIGFKILNYSATLPLALVLMVIAFVPTMDDLRRALRRTGA